MAYSEAEAKTSRLLLGSESLFPLTSASNQVRAGLPYTTVKICHLLLTLLGSTMTVQATVYPQDIE